MHAAWHRSRVDAVAETGSHKYQQMFARLPCDKCWQNAAARCFCRCNRCDEPVKAVVTQRNSGKGLSGKVRRQRISSYIEAGRSQTRWCAVSGRSCWHHFQPHPGYVVQKRSFSLQCPGPEEMLVFAVPPAGKARAMSPMITVMTHHPSCSSHAVAASLPLQRPCPCRRLYQAVFRHR